MTTTRSEIVARRYLNRDSASRQFIHVICGDAALDFVLSRLLRLFATPIPTPEDGTQGTYWHHDGLRPPVTDHPCGDDTCTECRP